MTMTAFVSADCYSFQVYGMLLRQGITDTLICSVICTFVNS